MINRIYAPAAAKWQYRNILVNANKSNNGEREAL